MQVSMPCRRLVTGHKDGKSTVLIDDKLQPTAGFAASASTIWQNHCYPAELADHDAASCGGLKMHTKGSLIRVVDFPPCSQGHNHRTKSLDYGIVIQGEIEMLLEDGSRTVVRAGDVVVQQATMHQWNNLTDKVCRMIFALLPSEAARGVNGEVLGECGVPMALRVEVEDDVHTPRI